MRYFYFPALYRIIFLLVLEPVFGHVLGLPLSVVTRRLKLLPLPDGLLRVSTTTASATKGVKNAIGCAVLARIEELPQNISVV